MDVIARNFRSLSTRSTFMSMEFELVEDIVKHPKLQVQSELDVMHAIIRWVMKRGHQIESDLARQLFWYGAGNSKKDKIPEMNNANERMAFNEEHFTKLTSHIPVSKLSLAGLKDLVHLCGQARFGELKDRCMNQFLQDEPRFELAMPVHHLLRASHVRNSPVFTFQHQFNNISAQRTPSVMPAEYIRDALGAYSWCLLVIDNLGGGGYGGNGYGDGYGVGYPPPLGPMAGYGQGSSSRGRRHNGRENESEDIGWRLESLENIINRVRDSLILGVTIYFEPVNT